MQAIRQNRPDLQRAFLLECNRLAEDLPSYPPFLVASRAAAGFLRKASQNLRLPAVADADAKAMMASLTKRPSDYTDASKAWRKAADLLDEREHWSWPARYAATSLRFQAQAPESEAEQYRAFLNGESETHPDTVRRTYGQLDGQITFKPVPGKRAAYALLCFADGSRLRIERGEATVFQSAAEYAQRDRKEGKQQ